MDGLVMEGNVMDGSDCRNNNRPLFPAFDLIDHRESRGTVRNIKEQNIVILAIPSTSLT